MKKLRTFLFLAVLGLAVATKIYPLVLLPPLLVYVARRQGGREAAIGFTRKGRTGATASRMAALKAVVGVMLPLSSQPQALLAVIELDQEGVEAARLGEGRHGRGGVAVPRGGHGERGRHQGEGAQRGKGGRAPAPDLHAFFSEGCGVNGHCVPPPPVPQYGGQVSASLEITTRSTTGLPCIPGW